MADDGNPKLIYLGTVEGGANVIVVPRAALASVEQKLDAEHARREAEAAKAKLAVLQSARARGRLRKLMRAVFRGHRRISQ
jgi:hypothetical protein